MDVLLCRGEIDDLEETKDKLRQNFQIIMEILIMFGSIVFLTGIYIVFIYNRKLKKPLFVKIIWSLITAAWIVNMIIILVCTFNDEPYFENLYKKDRKHNQLLC